MRNRLNAIRSLSAPEQWGYVRGEVNPADLGTRGLTMDELLSCRRWWNGPDFLLAPQSFEAAPDTRLLSKDALEEENSPSTTASAMRVQAEEPSPSLLSEL